MPRLLLLLLIATGLLMSCVEFPDLDRAISPSARNADFPTIIPTDALFDGVSFDPKISAAVARQLQTRANHLRRRARALRAPVIDRATLTKLNRALRNNERRLR